MVEEQRTCREGEAAAPRQESAALRVGHAPSSTATAQGAFHKVLANA
jgi:hypothetical protein